jgi:LysM repeat protein
MFASAPAKNLGRQRDTRRQITRRKRGPWGILLKVAILTFLVGAITMQVVLGTAGSRGPSVTVQSGQTLWGIATQHYPNQDPRAAVAAIESTNHLAGAGISPGERLLLPPM